jgi:polyisoprenoid-binding protein YceI
MNVKLNRTAALLVSAMICGALHSSAADVKKTAPASAKSATYTVVPEQSELKWTGKKVTGQHDGTVPVKSGEIKTQGDLITGGSVVIDVAGLTVKDITDPETNGKLTGHLKSDDFFGTEKYPTATFEITKVTPNAGSNAGDANVNVHGTLTVKGQSHPSTFPANVTMKDGMLMAKASGIKVNRTLYGIKYGSGSFFKGLGDKAISDDFVIDLTLVAKR